MLSEFLRGQLDYIFFCYGLAFVLLAATCAALRRQDHAALPWGLLGLFGLVHGTNEWLDMLALSLGDHPVAALVRCLILAASFLVLLEFARQGLAATGGVRLPRWACLPLLLLAAAGALAGTHGLTATTRYALALPAGLTAAYTLLRLSRRQLTGRRPLQVAALLMAAYALAAGAVVPKADFPPASLLNYESLIALLHVPVQLLRGIFAVGLSLTVWHHYAAMRTTERQESWDYPRSLRSLRVLVAMLFVVTAAGWLAVQYASEGWNAAARRGLRSLVAALAAPQTAEIERTSPIAQSPENARALQAELQARCDAQGGIVHARLFDVRRGLPVLLAEIASADHRDSASDPALQDQLPQAQARLIGILPELAATGGSLVQGPIVRRAPARWRGWATVNDRYSQRVLAVLELELAADAHVDLVARHRLGIILGVLLTSLLLFFTFVNQHRVGQSTARLLASEQLYRTLVEGSPNCCTLWDHDGRCRAINRSGVRHLGRDEADLLGTHWLTLWPQSARDAAEQLWRQASQAGQKADAYLEYIRPDGRAVVLEAIANPMTADRNGLRQVVCILIESTERVRAQSLEADRQQVLEMIAQNRLLHEVLQRLIALLQRQYPGSAASILILHDGRLEHVAPNLPEDLAAAVHRQALSLSIALCDQARAQEGIAVTSLDDDPTWRELRGSSERAPADNLHGSWALPITAADEQIMGLVLLYHPHRRAPQPPDAAVLRTAGKLAAIAIEHRYLTDQLSFQAQHDPLTGLPNRARFGQELQRALAVAPRPGHLLALLFIDIDRFKAINDTFGHHTGDLVLRQLTQRLQDCSRQVDMLGRLGGDEFALLMQGLSHPDQAIHMAQTLRRVIQIPIEVAGREVLVSASIGISLYPQHGSDAATLQRNADLAMYRVKQQGRNGYACFTDEMNVAIQERVDLEADLRQAIDQHQLVLHFQPQVDPQRRLLGFEALLRWNHPTRGLLPPHRFIAIAEESGLIVPVGNWVVQEACRQAARWQRTTPPAMPRQLRMAVNVSALQFAQPDFVEAVNSALRRSGLDGACLELELTESLLMQQTQQSVEKLEQLRGLGVRIAVDDFGTGYSSLAYLHRLPIDTLKIDRSFVQEISRGPEGVRRKDAIVRAIASLAHSLELKVVAEGVETEPQRQFLQSLACDAMQGFLFGHPQPASAFDALLGATSRPTLSPQDSATPPESGALTLTAEASTV